MISGESFTTRWSATRSLAYNTRLLWSMPAHFILGILLPALEAVAAGSLCRRYRRPWPLTIAYVERIVPLALTLIGAPRMWTAVMVPSVMVPTVIGAEGLGVYELAYWNFRIAPALLIAQVATWREWPVWLRLLLHAGWIGLVGFASLVVFARLRLP